VTVRRQAAVEVGRPGSKAGGTGEIDLEGTGPGRDLAERTPAGLDLQVAGPKQGVQ
jgi:hypothetical protein